MYKKTITFEDYEGVQRTEDYYFNISKAELIDMEMTTPGGFRAKLQRIIDSPSQTVVWETFKELILSSYGRKSLDGKRFEKKPEYTEEFVQTEAYSELLGSFFQDSKLATEFITGILPKGSFVPEGPQPTLIPEAQTPAIH